MVTSKSVINISNAILDIYSFSSTPSYIDNRIVNPFHFEGSIVL